MKNYTQTQLNKQRQRINRAVERICLPIMARSQARYDHMETFLRAARQGQITPAHAIKVCCDVATASDQSFTSERFLPTY